MNNWHDEPRAGADVKRLALHLVGRIDAKSAALRAMRNTLARIMHEGWRM